VLVRLYVVQPGERGARPRRRDVVRAVAEREVLAAARGLLPGVRPLRDPLPVHRALDDWPRQHGRAPACPQALPPLISLLQGRRSWTPSCSQAGSWPVARGAQRPD
jgi:hypothetical protein